MVSNKYSQALEQITVPPELKEKTRRMLINRTATRKNIWFIGTLGVVAAAIALAVGVSIWMPGVFRDAGTPRDMELNYVFVSGDAEASQPVRMAQTYPLRREMSLDDFEHILPAGAPDGFTGPEGGVTAFFTEPSDVPDAILGEVVYRSQYGGSLTVLFTDTSMLNLPVEISGSQVAGVQVGAGRPEADDKYYAAFEKNSHTFLVTGESITQQEFERILYFLVASP